MEITILKTKHSSRDEARKLLPYILSCNLFGPEHALLQKEDALKTQKYWMSFLKEDVSRTKALEVFREPQPPESPPDVQQYHITMNDYLYRNKIPLLYFEQWSSPQVHSIDALRREGYQKTVEADTLFRNGKRREAVERYYEAICRRVASSVERDKHIAQNLDNFPSFLAESYPALDSASAHYVLQIGGRHFPEKYCKNPVNIVNLVVTDSAMEAFNVIEDCILQEAPRDEVIELLMHRYEAIPKR